MNPYLKNIEICVKELLMLRRCIAVAGDHTPALVELLRELAHHKSQEINLLRKISEEVENGMREM